LFYLFVGLFFLRPFLFLDCGSFNQPEMTDFMIAMKAGLHYKNIGHPGF